jgi:hypothetical protein
MFLKTHSEWIRTANDPESIETCVAVDNEQQAKMLPSFDVIITGNKKAGVCFPCYCLSSSGHTADNSIIVFASDDFFPHEGWDTELRKRVDDDKPCVLVVNDGIQKHKNKVVTIPILNFSALKKLNGVIYHPAYSHLWSDVELYDVAEELGIIKDIRDIDEFEIEHRHHCRGKRVKDYQDVLVDEKYKEDKDIYEKRKTLPLSEKLAIESEVSNKASETIIVNNNPVLSILICSIVKRKQFLDRLLACLIPQVDYGVEILVEEDDGTMKIGAKRNMLLGRAKGQYCCFIDDDDLVSKNYISNILSAIKTSPDCCSLTGEMTTDGENPVTFIHSLKYDRWFDEKDSRGNRIYYRCPNHLNVIKTSLCKQVMFNSGMNVGEDRDFSERIRPLLRNEVALVDAKYYYLFVSKKDSVPVQKASQIKPTVITAPKNKFVIYAPWRN